MFMENLITAKKTEENGIIIFTFFWDLDETNARNVFENIHFEIWDFKQKKVIFNFKLLKYLNSKSLWYISEICSYLDENEWKFYICNCSNKIKEILKLVWVDYILPIVATQKDAIDLLKNIN
jgi:anti-anti-sigma factor